MNLLFSYFLRPVYYFFSAEKSLKLAVIWSDLYGVEYVISNKLKDITINKTIIQNSESFLITSYSKSNLLITEKLIKIGLYFKGEYILYTKSSLPVSHVIHHLNSIKNFIDQDEFQISNHIITARYADPLAIIEKKSCIDCQNILLSQTYTNNQSYNDSFVDLYKSFYDKNDNSQSFIIKDIILSMCIKNHFNQTFKIISPVMTEIKERGFYDHQLNLVYTPFYNFEDKEKSTFIHEGAHSLMYDQFKNKGKPFQSFNNNAMLAYENAAVESLISIGSIIGFKYEHGLPKTHNSINVAFDLFFNSTMSLFHFCNVLSTKKIAIADKNFILNEVLDIFELDENLIELYGTEQAIYILKQQIITDYNITTDQIILLERIGEYVARANPHSYFNEFIVRLPELIIRGLDRSALIHMDALLKFWLEYISPTITESINSLELKECSTFIDEDINKLIVGINLSNSFEEDL
jgi:hypothetical protein